MARTIEQAAAALSAARKNWEEQKIPMSKSADANLPLPTSGTYTIPAGIIGVVPTTTTAPNVKDGKEARRGNFAFLTEEGVQIPQGCFTGKHYNENSGEYDMAQMECRAKFHNCALSIEPSDGYNYKVFNKPVKVTFKTIPSAWTGSWSDSKHKLVADKEVKNYILMDVELVTPQE